MLPAATEGFEPSHGSYDPCRLSSQIRTISLPEHWSRLAVPGGARPLEADVLGTFTLLSSQRTLAIGGRPNQRPKSITGPAGRTSEPAPPSLAGGIPRVNPKRCSASRRCGYHLSGPFTPCQLLVSRRPKRDARLVNPAPPALCGITHLSRPRTVVPVTLFRLAGLPPCVNSDSVSGVFLVDDTQITHPTTRAQP